MRQLGIYSSQVSGWRKRQLAGLSTKRGPKAKETNPLDKVVAAKDRRIRELENRLKRAELMLEIQKKSPGGLGYLPGEGRRQRRERLMPLALELAPGYGSRLVADAMGLSHATLRRRLGPKRERAPRPSPAKALNEAGEQAILDVLHSERFVDVAPAEVVATLLDEGRYLGSVRTYYRVLAKHQEVKERRKQLIHPKRRSPGSWPPSPTRFGAGTSPS
jgi:hypothetical protein